MGGARDREKGGGVFLRVNTERRERDKKKNTEEGYSVFNDACVYIHTRVCVCDVCSHTTSYQAGFGT